MVTFNNTTYSGPQIEDGIDTINTFTGTSILSTGSVTITGTVNAVGDTVTVTSVGSGIDAGTYTYEGYFLNGTTPEYIFSNTVGLVTTAFATGDTPFLSLDVATPVITAGAPPPCFVTGTRIATPNGDVPVETLSIGDIVLTADGVERPILWIGRRAYAGRFLAGHPELHPIRFRAGSLGDGLPRNDLLVSPKHAMFIDGLLVPADCLVNGLTILRERQSAPLSYFHIELARHDVIMAEGAPTETFVDDDSRGLFHNAHEFRSLYPDAVAASGFCARRVESGHELEAIRKRHSALAQHRRPALAGTG